MILKEDINLPKIEDGITVCFREAIDLFNSFAPESPIILAIALLAKDGDIEFFKETADDIEDKYPELVLYSYEGEDAVKYLDERSFPFKKSDDNSIFTKVGYRIKYDNSTNPILVEALCEMRKHYDDVDTSVGMSICGLLKLFGRNFYGRKIIESEKNVANFFRIYNNAYDRLCRNNQQTADYSGFIESLVDVSEVGDVYIPFANSLLLTYYDEPGPILSKDFISVREYLMDVLHPRYYGCCLYECPSAFSNMYVRSCDELFTDFNHGRDNMDFIFCDVPDNEFMANKIFHKMVECDYKEGYLFVRPHVLGDFRYSDFRRHLLESGRLAWVMSLPELKGTQRALLCFKTGEKHDAPVMIDAYSFHKLYADRELPEEEALVETAKFFHKVINGFDDTDVYKPLSKDEIPDDCVLNPKYYICPKPAIKGVFEYIKLSELISKSDIDYIDIDVPLGRYQFSTAPKNAFEHTLMSLSCDEDYEPIPIVCANVLLDYMDSVSNEHRYVYWTHADGEMDSSNAMVWDVNTQLISPEYLVWQLYRKDLFLQIASKESFSCDSALYDQTTGKVLDLLIPVPKGNDSMKLQKQLYEEARKLHFAMCYGDIMDLHYSGSDERDNISRSSVISSIFLTDDGCITFPEYNRHMPIKKSMFTSVYLFLLKKTEEGVDITDKDIHDYSYEITRIYHAISQKLNRYTDNIRWEEYKEIKEFLLSDDYRSKRSSFNKTIETILKPLTTQYKIYMIPKGNGKKRNIEIPAKLICESGNKRWDDLFSTPSHPNSYYPQVEELERWIRETDKAKKSGRELPDDVKRHISLF